MKVRATNVIEFKLIITTTPTKEMEFVYNSLNGMSL